MGRETWDTIQGAFLLVPVLIFIFIAAKVLAAFRNAQFNRGLSPLAPLIGGAMHSDGIHAAMTGSRDGKQVAVQITTGTRNLMFEGHSNQKRNILVIEMGGLPGKQDWTFDYGNRRVLDRNSWHLSADDKALEQRLHDSNVIAAITAMGNVPVIRYSARQKLLTYIEDIRPALAPSPERFQRQLELISHLVSVNQRVNTA